MHPEVPVPDPPSWSPPQPPPPPYVEYLPRAVADWAPMPQPIRSRWRTVETVLGILTLVASPVLGMVWSLSVMAIADVEASSPGRHELAMNGWFLAGFGLAAAFVLGVAAVARREVPGESSAPARIMVASLSTAMLLVIVGSVCLYLPAGAG